MNLNEYGQFDAIGLADLVRRKEVKPSELINTALQVIEKINPQINSVIDVFTEQIDAFDDTDIPEGPFTGVPFLIKDIGLHYANVPYEMGSRLTKGFSIPYDTELAVRYRRAGVVPIGRTNLPEFGMNVTTEPVANGPTRNPWNTDHIAGGSSGGSAASVSAGMVPMAHGNDAGGSIRIPASCCGIFGLKPTRGRLPWGPDTDEGLMGLATEHVLTRSVRDSAAMLDAVAGPDVGDRYLLPEPSKPYLEEVTIDPERLRIAFSTTAPDGVPPVHSECVEAVEKTAKLCEKLGHIVVETSPPFNQKDTNHVFNVLSAASITTMIELIAGLLGKKPSEENLEVMTLAFLEYGQSLKASDVMKALFQVNSLSRTFGNFFRDYDMLLTPTLAHPPLKIGELDANAKNQDSEELANRLQGLIPFSTIFNITGQPAMSVPLHWTRDGLPVGVQFVAKFAREDMLFRLAGQLELV